jgi:hypothetical protein
MYFKKIVALVCFALSMRAQVNLVMNPSFESYTACPSTGGDINKIVGWDTCRGSADYFNVCAGNSFAKIPINFFGHQYAAHGNGYCGFYTYDPSSFYREIIIGKLTSTMNVGQRYFISFRINRADSSFIAEGSSNKIGIKFTKVKQSHVPINNVYHFVENTVIIDTVNWTKISGSFVADSSYQYIMIGNFSDNANTTVIYDGSNTTMCYYYIDEVCVSTDSTFTENYTTEIKEYENKQITGLFPNPANTYFRIESHEPEVVDVYNIVGELIYKDYIRADSRIINCSQWPCGFYWITLGRKRIKLIVEH